MYTPADTRYDTMSYPRLGRSGLGISALALGLWHNFGNITPFGVQQELLRTNQALKDAYTRFNCVCDSELIEASIYEISALKARCNYLLRRIKELSGEAVPSAIPRARPVQAAAAAASAPEETPCMAAGAMKGGDTCRS